MKSGSKIREWYIITAIVNYLPQISRRAAYEIMSVLMDEKHITFDENYTITHLKTGMNIGLEVLRGVFVMKPAIEDKQKSFF